MVAQGGGQAGDRVEGHAVEIATDVERRAVFRIAVDAGAIEILQCQAEWVHQPVAAGAGWIGAVHFQPLPRGERALGLFQRGEIHIRRGVGNALAKEQLAHRPAAQGGRTAHGV